MRRLLINSRMRSKRELRIFYRGYFRVERIKWREKVREEDRGRALLDKQISQGFVVRIRSLEVFVRR